MTRKLIASFALLAFVALCLTLAGCPKKADNAAGAGPSIPGLPSLPKVTKSGDAVSFSGKDDKGNAVAVTSQKQGEAQKTTVKTAEGTTTAEVGKNKVTEQDLGIAFYPGATVDQGINAEQSGKTTGSVKMVMLKSTDPAAKVAAFYKSKYAKGNTVIDQGGSLMITINSGKAAGKMIMVAPAKDQQGTEIMIHSATGM
jgi:hypothetical protein